MMRHSAQASTQASSQTTQQPTKRAQIQARALCAAVMLAALPISSNALGAAEPKQVTVLGRNWVVEPAEEAPGYYRATRLNREMAPFRPPAVLSVRQAIRAIKGATGCSANLDTIYRTISGSYYATLICPQK